MAKTGGGGGRGGAGRRVTAKEESAANFWDAVRRKYGDTGSGRLAAKSESLRAGRSDWFRDAGLIRIIAANNARRGRIGFDQDKYDRIVRDIVKMGDDFDIDVGGMQS